LLNYWYSRLFDNVNINPDMFRQLPIFPADFATQQILVSLVDAMLIKHAEINNFRAQGYMINIRHAQAPLLKIPYDILLHELQTTLHDVSTLTLYDAKAIGLLSISDSCDLSGTISKNVFIPAKYPSNIVLRHNKFWLDVPDANRRKYLLNYLQRPQWLGKTWDDLKNIARLPEDDTLQALFALEQEKLEHISTLLNEIWRIDTEIDTRVLDLYGITDLSDRQRILGNAPVEEEDNTVVGI
ncbi:MAG: hypothetical protein ACRDHW_16350, partial [Ktedonobacteraceae bacterium]